MKRSISILATVVLANIAVAAVLLAGTTHPHPVQAESPDSAPFVTKVNPASAPNDLDTTLTITGTGFAAVPTVTLGATVLDDVGWVSAERLTATVPWGLDPGTYTLTVENPGGESGMLPNAFTVTQGIGVWTSNGPYGGHISQIRVNPHDPSTLYAIANLTGLLGSKDGAASWEPLLFNLNPPEQVCVDAGNPDVVYAGGGSPWRSTDGGGTWEMLTVHPPIPFIGRNYRLTADPVQAGVVYAAASNSSPPGLTGAILRSDSYGAAGSWITLTHGISDTDFVRLAVHPTAGDTLLAGTQGGNLYYSLDAGGTWTHTAQINHPVRGIFVNPYEPLEAWVAGEDAPYLFKSMDLTTWITVEVAPGNNAGGDVAFLPDTIWVAAWGVYTSTNGGANWTHLADSPGALSIAIHPAHPSDVYVGDFTDGVYKSADGGHIWQLASEGLAGLEPVSVLVTPDDPETVYAKVDFSLVKSQNGGQSWRSLDFGQGGFPDRTKLAIDPFQPERLYFGHGCPDSVCLWISDDGGKDPGNWISVTATLPPSYSSWNGAFYTLAAHPAVPGRILAGVEVWPPGLNFWDGQTEALLYGSDDYGLTWAHLGPTQPISWVTEIAFDSQNPALIYAATQGTGLWRSNNGGQSWAPTPNPSGFADMEFVTAHPYITNTVYVHASGEGSEDNGGLFVSHDAGETWTHLTWQAAVQLLFAPTQPPTLLTGCGLGNEFGAGVCQSQDDGQTWEQLEGISWPTALAAGSDGQRVMTYIGTPGGMVSPMSGTGTMHLEAVGARASEYGALGGGVYRYTTVQPDHHVYLPLVLRQAP